MSYLHVLTTAKRSQQSSLSRNYSDSATSAFQLSLMEPVPLDSKVQWEILPDDVWRNLCMIAPAEIVFLVASLSNRHRRITFENIVWHRRAASTFGAMDVLVDNYRLYFLRRCVFFLVPCASMPHSLFTIRKCTFFNCLMESTSEHHTRPPSLTIDN
jgi:hypothetical protein